MPIPVKKLHIAKDLRELNKINTVNVSGNIQVMNLAQSLTKLYKRTMELINEEEKDEEMTYGHCFKYMEVWNVIRASNEFKNNPKYYKSMHGKNTAHVMSLLEEYTEKLEKRYNELNGSVNEDSSKAKSGSDLFQMSQIIKLGRKKEIKDTKNIEFIKGNNGINIIPSLDKFLSENHAEPLSIVDDDSYNNKLNDNKKFIECPEVLDMLDDYRGVLILDIRSRKDYGESKISTGRSINIPESFITPGISANKLAEAIIPGKELEYWKEREEYRQVVLMDWFSEEKDVIPNSGLDKLLNILCKWDRIIYKNNPLILVGGFERWLDMYPTKTTNPKIQIPQKPVNNSFIHLSECNIDYPTNELDYISTLEPRPKAAQDKPTVDRTTKPEKIVGVLDATELPLNSIKDVRVTVKPPEPEPMEEEKSIPLKPIEDTERTSRLTSSTSAPTDNQNLESVEPHSSSYIETPRIPSRTEKPHYPTTPKKSIEKGIRDGDGETYFAKLKSDSGNRSGGLKRSASSPNINQMADEDTSSPISLFSPICDRSTKPKPAMDTIYLANNKDGRGLTGLKNLGNLCYMNSIMQCISNTVELTNELTRFNPKRDNSKRQIAGEVSSLLRDLWNATRVTSCRSLKERVGALRQSFSTSEQQDSHEFLTLLIDWLHDDLNEPSLIKSLEGAEENTGEKAWGEFKKKNNSLVLDLFYGQLKSTVTCNHCQKQSVLFEPFSNLSIPLPPPQDTLHDKDRNCTLQECLKLYLKNESISGWICPSCKTPREATKKLDITRLPPVLIIHLKRFMNEMIGVGWCRKRMNMVDFPISDFDMKPHTHRDSELRFHNYNLYAVSNHYGSMDSGHYTAYCKNHVLNKWYKFDDHDVNELSSLEIKTSAAYILFYESSQFQETVRVLN